MKKNFILAGLLVGLNATAQYEKRVGINTDKPRASLEVKAVTVDGKAQGILFPHISQEEKLKWQPNETTGLVAGTVIWNTDKKCLDYFDGEKWQCTDGTLPDTPKVPVTPINLPPNVKLGGGITFIASIYDDDYLPYSIPTTAADWTTYDAGNGKDKLVDYQGKITETGRKIQIPVTVTGSGSTSIPAYTSSPITISADKTQDGQSREIVIFWEEQTNITTATKYITATLKTVSGTLNVKKLDINKGIGNDGRGVFLGNIIYPSSSSDATAIANYEIRAIAGIPDRKFGETDQLHDFLYVPIAVTGSNGYNKVWLNNNLGANYSNINDTISFNPGQQAVSHDDWKAYGSLFQWQRPADGHELIINAENRFSYNYTNYVEHTLSNSWTPSTNKIIFYPHDNDVHSWVEDEVNEDIEQHNLWQTNGTNNPCPKDFHVPTKEEWDDLYNTFKNDILPLHLPSAGSLLGDELRLKTLGAGNYWSSSPYAEIYSYAFIFNGNHASESDWAYRVYGMSIRCIQD